MLNMLALMTGVIILVVTAPQAIPGGVFFIVRAAGCRPVKFDLSASVETTHSREIIMRQMKAIVGEIVRKLGTILNHAPLKRTACLAGAVCALALANFGLGDENEDSGKSKTGASSAARRTFNPDQDKPGGPNEQSNSEGHVRHHSTLGVLLSTSDDGVIIVGVIPGSPAERAGLRSGDQIRYVGDQRIRTIPELTETIGGSRPGTRVDLMIVRNGRRQIVEVNLASREGEAGPGVGPTTAGGPQASRGPRPGAPPTGPTSAQIRERQRLLNQRMLMLERQIYRLQQELNELRYSHSLNAHEAGDMQDWWERQHHGEAHDDPALFQ